jgi:hypothetical protein
MTRCVMADGTNFAEDHKPKVPTTGGVTNPNTAVGISLHNDRCLLRRK